MDFTSRSIVLKNGMTLTLRAPRIEDAQTLVEYLDITAGESPYLTREPGEKKMSADGKAEVEAEAAFIGRILESPSECMILAELGGVFAGNCQISFMTRRKTAHRASLAIALYRKFWNMGIGTAMMEAMLDLARERGVRQAELAYIEGNERGKALYEKMGFSECGRIPDAFRFSDGSCHDEIFMIKYMHE